LRPKEQWLRVGPFPDQGKSHPSRQQSHKEEERQEEEEKGKIVL
jgi:hypothetical protein